MSCAALEREIARADRLIAECERGGRVRHEGEVLLARSDYRPWWAQRAFHRSGAKFRVLVAGRGVGKTYAAAYELLQLVLSAPSGSQGGVLAPTYTHAEAAVATLRELSSGIPGVEWKQQAKRLVLPGGRSIRIYSLDRVESARGPSFVALWLDEAALMKFSAVQASIPALRSAKVKTRAMVTTTPVGKNWVWDWWCRAEEEGSPFDRFRFSSLDSPYQDQAVIAEMRESMSRDYFAQEYLAEFVDNLLLVFPDRSSLFVEQLPPRDGHVREWIGIDLGKRQDWTVAIAMNDFGETRILGRWRAGEGLEEGRFWGQVDELMLRFCRERKATAVIDTGGPGGAPGSVLAERLKSAGVKVAEVKTNVPGTKAKVVEQLVADVEHGRVRVEGHPSSNELARQLDYELSRFQGVKRVHRGQEITIYEGPQVPGEHDDCVIAFALANWGRATADEASPPAKIESYLAAARRRRPGASRHGGGGYRFRLPGR